MHCILLQQYQDAVQAEGDQDLSRLHRMGVSLENQTSDESEDDCDPSVTDSPVGMFCQRSAVKLCARQTIQKLTDTPRARRRAVESSRAQHERQQVPLVEGKMRRRMEDEGWSAVPTFHTRDFNEGDLMDGLADRPTDIGERRAGLKQKPRGGRPLYEAAVHKIAEKQSTLEKVMKDKQSSPEILT
ncbi:hypothetical protein MHYP_G00131240 [Metynnis hypsauchen]